MRVFMTGATGFIGTHVTRELIDAGHDVIGLVRSTDGATTLVAAGAETHLGTLEDPDSLRSGAADADAVIHLGFNNDFSRFPEVCAIDHAAIETLGAALAGTDKPLIVPNGLAGLARHSQTLTEADDVPDGYPFPRTSEQTALSLAGRGVMSVVIRLPQVHDVTKMGLVTRLVQVARTTGVSAYAGDGSTRWAAAHVLDVARLFRLVLERPEAGAKFHAVAEEGIAVRVIAETIGRVLGVPVKPMRTEEADAHFGPLSLFVGQEMTASSAATKGKTGWHTVGPTLLADLERVN